MYSIKHIKTLAGIALLAFAAVQFPAVHAQEDHGKERTHAIEAAIPSSLEAEHKELHEALAKLVKIGGRTGQAAAEVEKLLAPHFVKEEQMAMPQLGLLQGLAAGESPADAESAIQASERLQTELPQMLREHRNIVDALKKLRTAGQKENKPSAIHFADVLSAHALTEEQILYPAAILVGKHLKLQKQSLAGRQ